MRPLICWSDLRGARVGVWGLGVEGRANLRKLAELGADVVLVDDRPRAAEPPEGGMRPGLTGLTALATHEGGLEALASCEVVVKSPGISRYRPEVAKLADAGIPLTGGLGLWLAEADRDRVVLVTGTKGKSTTTAVIGHLLNRLGYRALVGGNIGAPPWDPASAQGGAHDYWVIETSSYQATDLPCSPPVVAVTSLHPDHLDWHGDVETYYRDKLSACAQPGADLTIANGDSDLLRARTGLLGPRVQWVRADDDPAGTWMSALDLLGAHNRRNALIARACLRALGLPEADDDQALREAAGAFARLPSRLTLIGEVGGVAFVDDSLSTNVLPTLAALDAFPGRRVALIAGGHDRGIDYAPLAAGIAARPAPTLVLAIPDSGHRIAAAIEAALSGPGGAGPGPATPAEGAAPAGPAPAEGARPIRVVECDGLADAVGRGFAWAKPDGVVLLSPAAPSFGVFRDYRDRGEAFARAMRDCAAS